MRQVVQHYHKFIGGELRSVISQIKMFSILYKPVGRDIHTFSLFPQNHPRKNILPQP